jgi:Uma2 family endonuclease
MVAQLKTGISPEEYLTQERLADFKSEYLDGFVYAMAGGSPQHNQLGVNITTELNIQLRQSHCNVYSSDLKIGVSRHGPFFYPDASVVCGVLEFHDKYRDVVLNPVLIIEVLSKSTANFDQGEKFEAYRRIVTLQEYVLVAQKKPHIMRYTRQSHGGWSFYETYNIEDTVHLASIECDLALADVYAKVDFSQAE